MLRVRDLHVSRGHTKVLKGIDMDIGEGEIATLIGMNGAGKTTMLMALSGLLPIASGSIELHIDGKSIDVAKSTPASLVRAGLIHCPEGRQIFGRLTVEENLLLGAYLIKGENRIATLLEQAFTLFPILHERRKLSAGGLSGGEQMMLAIARALMGEPRLLLLDEPSLGLAPQVTDTIFDTLCELNKGRGVTMLIIEQNAMLSLEVANHGFVLRNGRIELSGTGAELTQDAAVVDAYLGNLV